MKIVNSTVITPSREGLEIRNADSQTVLTFPPILPKEVEDILKKYGLADGNQSQEDEDDTLDSNDLGRSMMDVSTLRRKLFINRIETPPTEEYPNFDVHLSPAPRTPQLVKNSSEVKEASVKSIDSFGSDMFGELSPIRAGSPLNVSSNDISMISEYGHEKTPSRRQGGRNLKKGKNLSESFSLFESEEFKENLDIEDLLPSKSIEPVKFARFDSGFSDVDTKLSHEFMQF